MRGSRAYAANSAGDGNPVADGNPYTHADPNAHTGIFDSHASTDAAIVYIDSCSNGDTSTANADAGVDAHPDPCLNGDTDPKFVAHSNADSVANSDFDPVNATRTTKTSAYPHTDAGTAYANSNGNAYAGADAYSDLNPDPCSNTDAGISNPYADADTAHPDPYSRRELSGKRPIGCVCRYTLERKHSNGGGVAGSREVWVRDRDRVWGHIPHARRGGCGYRSKWMEILRKRCNALGKCRRLRSVS
ncbi:MAG: hypothetical protein Q8P39_00085 [Candidatus Yanofskybacteria bacterium]|nr:hypothetical protein [Candidatus Yanofskybacteria bacterium]